MILYTCMPIEQVLEGTESFNPQYIELEHAGGGKLIVEVLSSTEGRLVRLISPRPEDYLDPALQPGKLLSLQYTLN